MKKGLAEKEIKDIERFYYFDDEQAIEFLGRITEEEICGTYRVFANIPLRNAVERKNVEMLEQSFWNWLRDHKYGLEYLTDGKITYTDTNGLDTYRFH